MPTRHTIIESVQGSAAFAVPAVLNVCVLAAACYAMLRCAAVCCAVAWLVQLHRIFRVIGTPPTEAISQLANATMRRCLLNLAQTTPRQPQDLEPK